MAKRDRINPAGAFVIRGDSTRPPRPSIDSRMMHPEEQDSLEWLEAKARSHEDYQRGRADERRLGELRVQQAERGESALRTENARLDKEARDWVRAWAENEAEVERLRGLLQDTYTAWTRGTAMPVGRLREVEREVQS